MLRLSDTLISKIILIIFSLSYIICGIFVLNETTNNYNIWAYVFISLINYLANILLTLFINHIPLSSLELCFVPSTVTLPNQPTDELTNTNSPLYIAFNCYVISP